MVEKIAHEATRQPELFSTSNLRIALQSRLILGGEALNPNKKDLPTVSQESFGGISNATYGKLNHASTDERDQYWKQKSSGQEDLQGFDSQYLVWQQNVMDFVNSPKDKNRIQTLSHLSALGVNWQNFSDQEVDKIYNRYFKNQPKTASNIKSFVDDIITSYNGNYQAIKSDLVTIKKLANIFGGNSAELVEAAIEAQAKVNNPAAKQEFISQANETRKIDEAQTSRINWLNTDEDRLLRWLSDDRKEPPVVKIEPSKALKLTPELAQKDPKSFTKELFEGIRVNNPQLYQVWEFAQKQGIVSSDKIRIDPTTWVSESDAKDGITLGTQPMSKDAKYRILFDDTKFDYPAEVVYRLSHELSHKLLYYISDRLGQKSEFNHLLKTLVDLNQTKGRVISALASQEYYQQKGAEIQGKEDLTELINMHLQDPNYLKRYLNFLADDNYRALRKQYGLVDLDKNTAKALYEQIDLGLHPLLQEMADSSPVPKKKPIKITGTGPVRPVTPEKKPVPIRITPEQNLAASQTFCTTLRRQIKNGQMDRIGDTSYSFTDPLSGLFIDAPSKNAIDTAWTNSRTFTDWAERHNMPLVIWNQHNAGHYTLLLKGPERQPDGRYCVTIYNPFHDTEDLEEVPIRESFEEYRNRELPKMHYNAGQKRYDLEKGAYVPENRINHYLYSEWFKLPAHRSYQASDQAIDRLMSKTDSYNLSIAEDMGLPWELKVGKGQRMQFDGYNCGPLSFYAGVLRYAALPGHEEDKQDLVNAFASDFGVRILTRQELLNKQ